MCHWFLRVNWEKFLINPLLDGQIFKNMFGFSIHAMILIEVIIFIFMNKSRLVLEEKQYVKLDASGNA